MVILSPVTRYMSVFVKRLSNFLPAQSIYAEFHSIPAFLPNTTRKDIEACLNDFSPTKRINGGRTK